MRGTCADSSSKRSATCRGNCIGTPNAQRKEVRYFTPRLDCCNTGEGSSLLRFLNEG